MLPLRLACATIAPVLLLARSVPLHFEPNLGQAAPAARYVARAGSRAVLFTDRGPVFRASGAAVRMTLDGARRSVIEPLSALPGRSNYLSGSAPSSWLIGVPQYARLRYRSIYRGIDLVFHGSSGRLEYDFVLAPGADPRAVRMRFSGASRVALDRDDLVVESPLGEIRHRRPTAYQEAGGQRRYVPARYVLRGGAVAFELGPYDRALALTVDPVLVYATYFGGSGSEAGAALAVDRSGDAYLAGSTSSLDLPTTPGALLTAGSPGGMGFVVKLDSSGTRAAYATYIGGASGVTLTGIAVDSAGGAVVTGYSSSPFPATPGAYQTAGATGFVLKLSAAGDRIDFASVFPARPAALALDAAASVYVTGSTGPAFATTPGAAQPRIGGGCAGPSCSDAFLLKLSADGAKAVYASFLGGSAEDVARAVAVDSAGQAYLTGDTASSDFPSTSGAAQPKAGGPRLNDGSQWFGDAFVAKFDPSGGKLIYATYLGGSKADRGTGIAVDSLGGAYVAGATTSSDFPVTAGAYQTRYGGGPDYVDVAGDAFAVKLDATGRVAYSTYLGGKGRDSAAAIALDSAGRAYLAGVSESTDFPTTAGAIPNCRAGGPFVAVLDPNGAGLVSSTGVAGIGFDTAAAMALGPSDAVYLAGTAQSLAFFSTPGAVQKKFAGGDADAFVARLDLAAAPAPFVACVLNAASFLAGNESFFATGAVSPGEIVSVFGVGLGPSQPGGLRLTDQGAVSSSLAGTRVLFDGIPAPLLYVSPTQINAVVPYGLNSPTTAMTVERGDALAGPVEMPVAAAAPAIFTANGSGRGQAAAINQDGAFNSVANPAPRGSIITFFATGLGLVTPPVADGAVSPLSLPLPAPQLPTGVQIRGVDAAVQYAGAAPGAVSGLFQFNVVIPMEINFGNSIPLFLRAGNYSSQFQVSIAVK